jgi:hypothetical protein
MSRPLVQSGSPLAIVCSRSRIGTVMLVLSRRARRHLQTKRATVLAALPGLRWCDWLHGSESRFVQFAPHELHEALGLDDDRAIGTVFAKIGAGFAPLTIDENRPKANLVVPEFNGVTFIEKVLNHSTIACVKKRRIFLGRYGTDSGIRLGNGGGGGNRTPRMKVLNLVFTSRYSSRCARFVSSRIRLSE